MRNAELALGEGASVAGVRAAEAARDLEVGQPLRQGLGGHRRATVSVQHEFAGLHRVLVHALGDKPLGQRSALLVREEPADDERLNPG